MPPPLVPARDVMRAAGVPAHDCVGDDSGGASQEILAAFRAAWNGCSDTELPPTAQFIWLNACAATLAEGTLDFVNVERDGHPVALAPVLSRGNGFWRHWTLLGDSLYEPADVISVDADALNRLASRLLERGEPLRFDRLREDSPTISTFLDQHSRRARFLLHPRAASPFIPLDETWAEPEKHLNSQRRADLRRAQRRAEQHGRVSSEVLAPSVSELDQLLSTTLSVEAKSWKGEQKTALLHDSLRRPFYVRYAEAACRAGILRVCFLRIGDQPVAMQLAVESAGAFWLLKIGYDAHFARCSPGSLLSRDTIRYAARAGLKSYEFLGDVEPWTQVWTEHAHRCISLAVYPFTARGMLAYARSIASRLKHKCKRNP